MSLFCITQTGSPMPLNTAFENYIQLEKEAEAFGFNWPNLLTVLEQVDSECQEIQQAITDQHSVEHCQEEIGDVMQAAISVCLVAGFDVHKTLTGANTKFIQRLQKIQELAKAQGLANLEGQSVSFKLGLRSQVKDVGVNQSYTEKDDTCVATYRKMNKHAIDFGFNWPSSTMVIQKILQISQNMQKALKETPSPLRLQEYSGDLLQATLALCLFQGFDIEETLAQVNTKFANRLTQVKKLAAAQGLMDLTKQSFTYKLDLWKQAKENLNGSIK